MCLSWVVRIKSVDWIFAKEKRSYNFIWKPYYNVKFAYSKLFAYLEYWLEIWKKKCRKAIFPFLLWMQQSAESIKKTDINFNCNKKNKRLTTMNKQHARTSDQIWFFVIALLAFQNPDNFEIPGTQDFLWHDSWEFLELGCIQLIKCSKKRFSAQLKWIHLKRKN